MNVWYVDVNVALNKPVSQVSTYADAVGSRAVDGVPIQCRAPYHTCILGGQSTLEQRSMSTTSPLLMTATSPPVIIAGLSLLISHYSVSFLQILISFSQVCKINRDTLCDMASPLLDVKFQSLRKRSPWVHDPSSPNFCAQCLRPWLVQSVLFWRCWDALWLPVLWIASYWHMIGHRKACDTVAASGVMTPLWAS